MLMHMLFCLLLYIWPNSLTAQDSSKFIVNAVESVLRLSQANGVIFFLFQDATRLTSEISSDPNAGPQLVIWGTDVVVGRCKEKFRKFVQTFVDPDVASDERWEGMDADAPLYMQRLEEVGCWEGWGQMMGIKILDWLYWWFNARLRYLQCLSNGDTAVLR